jgi:hypothetical protein
VDLLATVRSWLRAGVEIYTGDVGKIESELDNVLVIKGWQGGDELSTVEAMITDAEREAVEIGQALKRASGIVGKALERDMENINRRYEALCKRREVLLAEIGAVRLTDTAFSQAGFNLQGDVDEATTAGYVEPEFFTIGFHVSIIPCAAQGRR